MVGHALAHAYTDRGDLGFRACGGRHPDTDPARAPLRADRERGERADDPFLKAVDEGADVDAAPLEIEHDVGDPLTRTVVGKAAAAATAEDRQRRTLDQLVIGGAGSAGVEGGMLKQPYRFRRGAMPDRRDALLHESDRLRIGNRPIARQPLDTGAALRYFQGWPALIGAAPGCLRSLNRGVHFAISGRSIAGSLFEIEGPIAVVAELVDAQR